MGDKIRVNNRNLVRNNRGKSKRIDQISQSFAIRLGTVRYLTQDAGNGVDKILIDQLEKLVSGEPVSTSVEELISWGNTREGVNLGKLVATGVPVLCSGAIVNSDERWSLISSVRNSGNRPPQHERVLSHGFTFGSVYAKAPRRDGSVDRIDFSVLCQRCLSTLVGTLHENGDADRSRTVWPFTWEERTNNRQTPKGKRSPRAESDKRKATPRAKRGDPRALAGVVRAAKAGRKPYASLKSDDTNWTEKFLRLTQNELLRKWLSEIGRDVPKSWSKDKLVTECLQHLEVPV